MGTIAIKTTDLSKTYKKGLRHQSIEALTGLDLEVRRGEVFGFIGSNGAGKSTTIKILMGLLRPTGGEAWLMGQPISSYKVRHKVGYLPEHPRFYDYLTPREFLRLVGTIHRMDNKKIGARADELLGLLSLQHVANRQIKGFSKGMVQRMGIAAALFGDPDLLVLDEPMSGLDPLGRHLVAGIIRNLQQQGKTVFFSTHIIPDIETLCDRVGIIVKGRLRYTGSIEKALYPPGNRLELTFRLPVSKIEKIETPAVWQKGGLTRVEIEEEEAPKIITDILESKGAIVNLEPKKRSLEELFLRIAGREGDG